MQTHKKSALLFSLLGALSLVACKPDSNNDNNDHDPTLDKDLQTPYDVSFKRGEANKDYENITPADVNNDDVRKAFFYAQNYAGNHDYYTVQKGFTDGGLYSQYIYASSVYKGPRSLSQFITAGEDKAGLGIVVKEAGRQLEDIHNGMGARDYATIAVKDKEGVVVNHDENNVVTDASVTKESWDTPAVFTSRNDFINETGHDLFNITNYHVPNNTAILTTATATKGQQYVYTFTFTTSHDVSAGDGRIDSSKYYQMQQQNIVKQSSPLPVEMDITSLKAEMTVNNDWSLSNIKFTETYDTLLGDTSLGTFTTTLDTSFTFLADGEDIADAAVANFYSEALQQFNLQ